MRKALLILLILMLSACAPSYFWQHPSKDTYAYERDTAICDNEAQREKSQVSQDMKGNPFAGAAMIAAYDRTFENCMAIKGWRKVEK